MMKKNIFYSGDEILTKTDLDGKEPEIYIICGNRTAGKSYYWKKMVTEDYMENGHLVLLLFRFIYDMDGCADAFWEDIGRNEFPGHEMTERSFGRGMYKELYLDGDLFGFATFINAANAIKKKSTRFEQVYNVLFDEFQADDDHYADDEVTKFLSIHTSVARGGGEMSRKMRWIMISNSDSVLNPYFVAMGIHKRLTSETRFLRGHGWVLEITYNENAAKAATLSRFNQAFLESDYLKSAIENKYLLDSTAFVEKMSTAIMKYQCTLVSDKKFYGIWIDRDHGYYYCNTHGDKQHPLKFVTSSGDHGTDTILINNNQTVLSQWRVYYNMGRWRFENLESKSALFDLLCRWK